MAADETVGVFDDHQPPAAAEHRHGRQLVEHFAPARFVATSSGHRKIAVLAPATCWRSAASTLPLQKGSIAKQHANGLRRMFFRMRSSRAPRLLLMLAI